MAYEFTFCFISQDKLFKVQIGCPTNEESDMAYGMLRFFDSHPRSLHAPRHEISFDVPTKKKLIQAALDLSDEAVARYLKDGTSNRKRRRGRERQFFETKL